MILLAGLTFCFLSKLMPDLTLIWGILALVMFFDSDTFVMARIVVMCELILRAVLNLSDLFISMEWLGGVDEFFMRFYTPARLFIAKLLRIDQYSFVRFFAVSILFMLVLGVWEVVDWFFRVDFANLSIPSLLLYGGNDRNKIKKINAQSSVAAHNEANAKQLVKRYKERTIGDGKPYYY